MSVPDHRDIPQKLFATDLYDLTSHDGQAAFTDAVVATLNGRDSKWRHLKKRPDQTHVHRHGEDSALYLLPDGKAQAVDFIAGAGGANPQPGWIVGDFEYKHSDAHDPDDHGIGGGSHTCPPVPPSFPYPDEGTAVLAFQNRVKKAYNDVGRIFPDPNDSDAYRHFARYGYNCHELPEPEAANKRIKELRAQLGAPPE
jgi:hypothetical protein